jgi:hypothetical protein
MSRAATGLVASAPVEGTIAAQNAAHATTSRNTRRAIQNLVG